MQTRLPTTSIYGTVGSGLPISDTLEFRHANKTACKVHIWKQRAAQWAVEWRGGGGYVLHVGISPWKGGCPLLAYMETEDSGVSCPWVARGNLAIQIRLSTTSIYGNCGQLTSQWAAHYFQVWKHLKSQ